MTQEQIRELWARLEAGEKLRITADGEIHTGAKIIKFPGSRERREG